eukprot:g61273.t1
MRLLVRSSDDMTPMFRCLRGSSVDVERRLKLNHLTSSSPPMIDRTSVSGGSRLPTASLAAATAREHVKRRRYGEMANQLDVSFVPIVIEPSGALGHAALKFLRRIQEMWDTFEPLD